MSLRPICFMVMPFGTKETGASAPHPPRVDFDALWHDAIAPALESMGYRAVRADQDTGAVIVKEMLERLFFSHLVVADISIANELVKGFAVLFNERPELTEPLAGQFQLLRPSQFASIAVQELLRACPVVGNGIALIEALSGLGA